MMSFYGANDTFFINLYRLLKIIITGLRDDKEFRFLFVFIVLLLVGATIFYTKIEHWKVIAALYFSVMTMATIGYGDFVPTTDISKVFTIIYALLFIGSCQMRADDVCKSSGTQGKDPAKIQKELTKCSGLKEFTEIIG